MPETPLPSTSYTGSSPIAGLPEWLDPGIEDGRLRLHIGGQEVRPGWKILNIQELPGVDFVGDCCDLSQFADNSVSVVYASHVLEHVSHREELPTAIAEIRRVLAPQGILLISVPDMKVLCELFLDESLRYGQRHHVMRILFGGQIDAHDFHRVGLWSGYLMTLLKEAGFTRARQVPAIGLFDDASNTKIRNRPISLNVIARLSMVAPMFSCLLQ